MERIFKFDLPEEQTECHACEHAMDWSLLAEDMDNWLRNKLKYGHEFKDADEALEAARTFLHDSLAESGLRLFEN